MVWKRKADLTGPQGDQGVPGPKGASGDNAIPSAVVPYLPQPLRSEDIAFAIVGEDGNRSWVEGDSTGKPTQYSAQLLRDALNLNVLASLAVGGLQFVDSDGNSSPDLMFADDGSFTLDAAKRIVERGSNGFRPLRKTTRVYCWGDSLTALNWAKYAQTRTGVWFTARGVGGQSPNDIAARQGGVAISFQIAAGGTQINGAGGTTTLTKLAPTTGFNVYAGAATWTWVGMLGPVSGTLAHDATNDVWTFTSDAGTTSNIPPSGKATFVVTAEEESRNYGQVLWVGRNDRTTVQTAVKAMVDHIAYAVPYLVIGITAVTGDATDLANIRSSNLLTQAMLHPDDWLDLQALLATQDVLTRVGLTPTTQDLADIAAGFIPRQIMQDDLKHFTDAGTNAIGQIIGETMQTRGKI